MAPVIVIGAGLAGLAAAATLHRAGVPVQVIDAADAVGGRVRTDVVDGFACDRGFQVLLGAYPRAAHWFPPAATGLHAFEPGALVQVDGRLRRIADPRRRPWAALGMLSGAVFSPGDALAMHRWLRDCNRPWGGSDRPLLMHLQAHGFSARSIERFWRPFLAGITLDRSLAGSARFADFVLGCFSTAPAYLPAGGIGVLPAQLAAGLPASAIRLASRVEQVASGRVMVAGGESLAASAVIIAVDPDGARSLGFAVPQRPWLATTAMYFAAERDPVGEPILMLEGAAGGPVNSLCVPSTVAPGHAPSGAHLVSASILGLPSAGTEIVVREQLRSWFGAQVDTWRHLRTSVVAKALPSFPPGTPPASDPRLAPGIWRAGDAWGMPAIEGAISGGEAAAAAVLAER